MAWIRRVPTASGATAAQVAEYVDGRRRIVAHVGSAHTETELGLLLEQAKMLLVDAGQGELDLGVEPTPVRARLLAPSAGAPTLFGAESAPAGGRAGRKRVSPPRVVGTSSRLLFDTLAGLYDDLGFGVLGDETFRDLVIARVVEPTSILDTGRVLTDLGQEPASEKTMRRTLARARQRGYRDQLATACFTHVLQQRGCVAVPLRRDDAVLRGRERGRATQGRLLQLRRGLGYAEVGVAAAVFLLVGVLRGVGERGITGGGSIRPVIVVRGSR